MELYSRQIHVDRYWILLDTAGTPTIRLDARFLDRVLVDDNRVVLAIGGERPTLEILDGASHARTVVELLAQYTRSAQILHSDVYQDAKRRLELASRGKTDNGAFALYVGNDDVFVYEDTLTVGKFKCLLIDVELYARAGDSLPLPNGLLDAGLAMLVVAAGKRREDLEALARRVSDYETELASR